MKTEEDKYPLISVITVNYNQSSVTCELLQSLQKISYPNMEIIVVDNASPNDTPDRIKELYPGIILIKSKENLGFAGGNNLGIRVAKGKYLFFLNNDTEVPAHIMEPMVELLENRPEIGAVSPKIKYFQEPGLVQYAGFTRMNPWTIRNKAVGYRQPDSPEFDQLTSTNSVHGAAMMIPRRVIDEVGLMPEIFFLYYEEHDWAEMIKRAGYKIYYQPASFILHKESISTGKNSPLITYYLTRNRLLFARRNFRGLPFLFSLFFQTFISFPKNTVLLLVKHQQEHLKAYLKGILWNFKNSCRDNLI
ncbi:MAG: glycosyltransferase family 2 protein [bacterium]